MGRPRNFKAEYRQRKASGLSRGFSLPQSRGHPSSKKKERSVREVKREAKAKGVDLNRVAFSLLGEPVSEHSSWREIKVKDWDAMERLIASLPNRAFVWIVGQGLWGYEKGQLGGGGAGTSWKTIQSSMRARDALDRFSSIRQRYGLVPQKLAVRWQQY